MRFLERLFMPTPGASSDQVPPLQFDVDPGFFFRYSEQHISTTHWAHALSHAAGMLAQQCPTTFPTRLGTPEAYVFELGVLAYRGRSRRLHCTPCACIALLPVLTNVAPPTVLALVALAVVLANVAPPTVLALGALAPMLTDAGPSALLARAALAPMLTDAGPSALLARVASSPMLTDVAPSALLAVAALAPMWAGHFDG